MSRSLRIRDEQIVCAIIAGGLLSGRPVRSEFGNGFISTEPDGPCCAVGAGVLYADADFCGDRTNTIQAFARRFGVSRTFAIAVSDGFEARPDGRPGYGTGYKLTKKKRASADYTHGYAIGAAVWASVSASESQS